jgi:hypothetical protein
MFSQPKKVESGVAADTKETDHARTIHHLDTLFSERSASDILKIGFDDTLVSYITLPIVCRNR